MGFLGRMAASAGLLGERLVTLSPLKLGLVVAGTSAVVAGGVTVVAPGLLRPAAHVAPDGAAPAREWITVPKGATPSGASARPDRSVPDLPLIPAPLVPPPAPVLPPPAVVTPQPATPPRPPAEPAPSAALPPVPAQPASEPEPGPQARADGTWQSTPYPEMRDKADAFLMMGDVTSARLWLSTASDKGDAEAMFKLAETYDPTMLGEWRVVGLTSDKARARALYEKSLTGGVEAARERIDRLGR